MNASGAMLARLAAVGLAAGIFLASAARHARGLDLSGINDAKMAWRPPGTRAAVAAAMAAAGARHVRLMAVRPLDAVAESAAALKREGIAVLLMIPLGQPEFFAPQVPARSADAVHYALRPTAEMDRELYEAFLRETLRALDERGVRPEAIELGNEINISPFEATLPIVGGGLAVDATDFDRQAFAVRYEQALDRYVEILRTTRALLTGRSTPLLMASVVSPEKSWAAEHGVSVVAPDLVMRMLMKRGAGDLVDGYALHLYPQVNAREPDPDRAVRASVDAVLDPLVKAVGPGRRWWVTEWGFARSIGRDSGKELPRGRRMDAFATALEARPEASSMGPAFLYDFSEDELFRINGPDSPSDPDALLTLSHR